MSLRRVAAFFVAVVVLWACGGGGGGENERPVVAPGGTKRTGIDFGYYGQDAATVLLSAQHATVYMAADFYGLVEQMAGLTHAKAAGYRKVYLMVPAYHPNGLGEVRHWLTRLKAAGLLVNITALYPIDEPDTRRAGARSDAEVTAKNAELRALMAEFPELQGARLAVFYGCSTGETPGFASYDLIGCDDYDSGCGVLTRYYDSMKARLAPHQRLMLIPGGASGLGRGAETDPRCFLDYAHANPQVESVIAFIFQTVTDAGNTYVGIAANRMRLTYCRAGQELKNPTNPEPCA